MVCLCECRRLSCPSSPDASSSGLATRHAIGRSSAPPCSSRPGRGAFATRHRTGQRDSKRALLLVGVRRPWLPAPYTSASTWSSPGVLVASVDDPRRRAWPCLRRPGAAFKQPDFNVFAVIAASTDAPPSPRRACRRALPIWIRGCSPISPCTLAPLIRSSSAAAASRLTTRRRGGTFAARMDTVTHPELGSLARYARPCALLSAALPAAISVRTSVSLLLCQFFPPPPRPNAASSASFVVRGGRGRFVGRTRRRAVKSNRLRRAGTITYPSYTGIARRQSEVYQPTRTWRPRRFFSSRAALAGCRFPFRTTV